MKPEWNGTKIRIIDGKAHEISKCFQCLQNCIIIRGLKDILPENCPKDYDKFKMEVRDD